MDIRKKADSLGIDKNEYNQLLKLFIKTSAKELADLQEAVKINDMEKSNRLLHSFKGAVVNLGLNDFAARCQILENLFTTATANEIIDYIQILILDIDNLKRHLCG